jgi:hypothetical protein
MTANRPYAAWLRRLAGLVALAGVFVLSACGGGSGAPNNPFTPPAPAVPALTVFPSGPTIYSQVASTLTISGGVAPYRAFSSNAALLPVTQSLPGNTITLLAGSVSSTTTATITIQDSAGTSITSQVTILPGPVSPPPPLVVLPSPVDVYSTIATQLTVSGGVPPYRAFSSNTAVLPVTQNVPGSIVNLVPTTVTLDVGVVITIQDSVGQSATVNVTVHPKAVTPPPPLVVLPSTVVTSKGAAVTLTISGGLAPFKAYSSNPAVVPVAQAVAGTSIVLVPNSVAADTNVVVSVQDAAGQTATVGVLVQPESTTPAPPLAVLPSSLTIFSGVATSVSVTGGVPPYTAFSSNSAVLPITQAVTGSAIPLLAANVSADTAVTLTVADSVGKTATAAITVRAATLFSAVVVKPNLTDCGTTAICSGQTGTATVTLQLPGGGAAPGRQVRFDVVAGPYAIAATGGGASAQSVTVVSDALGNAQVIIRANVDAPTQPAQIRATDITSGQQLTGDFLIQQRTDGSTILTVVPPEATITGAFTDECSLGFRIDYFIYGGTPPYRITQAFPTASVVIGTSGVPGDSAIVTAAGGFFEAVTNGTCVNPQTFSILDATGRQTTAQLFNLVGTTAPTPPTPAPDLSVVPGGVTFDCTAVTGNVVDFVISGGTPPYNASASPRNGTSPTIQSQNTPPNGSFAATPVVTRSGGIFRIGELTQTVVVSFIDSSNPKKTQTRTITCQAPAAPGP